MLLLLDIQYCPILECPLNYICFWRCTLDVLALGELAPKGVEFLEFDEMPDAGEWGGNDGRFGEGGRGWNASRHDEAVKLADL